MAARLLPWKVVIEDRHDSPGNATKLLQHLISVAKQPTECSIKPSTNFTILPLIGKSHFDQIKTSTPLAMLRGVFTVHEFWFHATSTVDQPSVVLLVSSVCVNKLICFPLGLSSAAGTLSWVTHVHWLEERQREPGPCSITAGACGYITYQVVALTVWSCWIDGFSWTHYYGI